MNPTYYDQLHELLHGNPKLDIFNLYFLGLCTEYTSENTTLAWLLNQLPLNFPRLFEVFMGNKHEIGFISRTLLRIIHNIPQEDRLVSTQEIFDSERSEIEEDLKRILKDFELVRLLYPRVTKFQWFYLGIFMAKNRPFELLALLKEIYIELLVKNYKYDEKGKVDFLASLLNDKHQIESLPPSSRATRAGKIQVISSRLSDLKRDLRSLRSLRKDLDEREKSPERADSRGGHVSLRINPLALRKETSPPEDRKEDIGQGRYLGLRRPVFRSIVNSENRDPLREGQHPARPKFSSIYQNLEANFPPRRPLQVLDTNNLEKVNKFEPIKCLGSEKIPPKPLQVSLKQEMKAEVIPLKEIRKEVAFTSGTSGTFGQIRSTNNTQRTITSLEVIRSPFIAKKLPDCPICFEVVMTVSSTTSLKLCKHSFHSECLQEYFQTRVNEKSFPIVCPMDGCVAKVLESQIVDSLDDHYKDKFYSFSLKHFAETHPNEVFCCPTPDCEFLAMKDPTIRSFYCKKCSKAFCVKCQEEWHDGKTCEESKREDLEEKKFHEYVTTKGCQKCPSCLFYIEKTEGCNHMTCRCGKEFCYSCSNDMDQCACREDRDEYENYY